MYDSYRDFFHGDLFPTSTVHSHRARDSDHSVLERSPSINFGVTIPIAYFTPTEEELQIYSDAFGMVRKGFDWGW